MMRLSALAAACQASIHLQLLYLLSGRLWTRGYVANSEAKQVVEVPRENPCRDKDHTNHTEKPRFLTGLALWPFGCTATTPNHHNL